MAGERFTAYLSEDERAALRALAVELNCSENYIVRMVLRAALFDQPMPAWLAQAAAQVTRVTQVTGART